MARNRERGRKKGNTTGSGLGFYRVKKRIFGEMRSASKTGQQLTKKNSLRMKIFRTDVVISAEKEGRTRK